MIFDHLLGKGADILVLCFVQSLLTGLDVELVGRIGDVGNWGIGGLCRLVSRACGRGEQDGAREGTNEDAFVHGTSFRSKRSALPVEKLLASESSQHLATLSVQCKKGFRSNRMTKPPRKSDWSPDKLKIPDC